MFGGCQRTVVAGKDSGYRAGAVRAVAGEWTQFTFEDGNSGCGAKKIVRTVVNWRVKTLVGECKQ